MKKMTIGAVAAFIVLISMLAGTAFAHHSFSAEYDRNKPLKMVGKITDVKLVNPHSWLYIDVVGPDGKVTNWALEMAGAGNVLIRRGWRKEDLKIGTEIHVEGYQARSGHPTLNLSSATFPDGRKLFAGSSSGDDEK